MNTKNKILIVLLLVAMLLGTISLASAGYYGVKDPEIRCTPSIDEENCTHKVTVYFYPRPVEYVLYMNITSSEGCKEEFNITAYPYDNYEASCSAGNKSKYTIHYPKTLDIFEVEGFNENKTYNISIAYEGSDDFTPQNNTTIIEPDTWK